MEVLYTESAGKYILLATFLFTLLMSLIIIYTLYNDKLSKTLMLILLTVIVGLSFWTPYACQQAFEHVYVRFTEPVDMEDFYDKYKIVGKKGDDVYILIMKGKELSKWK